MNPKTNPADELKTALDKCEAVEASLIKEANLLRDSASEFRALQSTIDIADTAQVQRMTTLLTISTVGTPRRTYRHAENEAAQKALVEACQTFSSKVFGPRLRDLQARALAKVKGKLKPHFPHEESLLAACEHSPELSALAEIAGHQVLQDYTPGGAIRQAHILLEAWSAADKFAARYLD